MTDLAGAGKSALDLCDEAVHLIRQAPTNALAIYYLGSVPFILGLLFFWTDMSSSATARDHSFEAALAMALLYLWLITCQSVFAGHLRSILAGQGSSSPAFTGWLRVMTAQAAIQPTKLLVLPAALLLTLPFPAVFAFYHNAAVTNSSATARTQARLWPKQNLTFLAILIVLALVVFINVAMTLGILPYLAKMLLGMDTVFTRGTYTVFNTTFLSIATGLTYLVLNPFVKAFYVLRCFYGESLTTAEDLRVELKSSTAALVLLLVCLCPLHAAAQSNTLPNDLDRSIERVLQRPEYAWRLPPAPRPENRRQNWFVRSTLAFLDSSRDGLRKAGHWVQSLAEWLGDRFGNRPQPLPTPKGAKPPASQLRILVLLLLAATAGLVTYLLWSWLVIRHAQPPIAATTAAPAIDLRSNDLEPAQQTLDQWRQMARDCIDRGDFRLALRALYLAGLSTLASQTFIGLNRTKSDRDYVRELKRRARNHPAVVSAFASNLEAFERGWYGMYDVDLATITQFEANLDQLRPRAEP